MADLSIQGEVVVNSEKAESAFNRVGDKASQMANDVATSANKAGQAVDKIGDGAGASAEKFTRAESRISASIKRATTELELLGKTASQRLEFNIADKGLDASKFEPALKKLREIEAQAMQAQRAATGSLDKMGVSAAQTAAALRGVPAQFTDIVTSLQGGQAPLTVFLQQGGQLRDMFGGAGNAARALGGYVLGLVNPFTIAAAAVAGIAVAYNQGAKEADAYRAALVTTGNAAGTNAAQLKSYAQEISSVVGTQGKAAEALSALAATGKVGAENLREAAQAAVAYERATGQAASKTAEQFASLRNEPLSAVLKLNEGMNFLTDSTYKQIKSLEEQGKTAEAANVAQRAFADTLSGRAGEMERNLGAVERGWLAVKDAAKSAWDAILNVGRASTSVDQLSDVRKQIAARENQLANDGFGSNGGGAAFGRPSSANSARLSAELTALKAQAAALEGVAFASKTAAEAERQRGESVKASAAFDKAGERFLTDKVKMERELAVARTQGAEAGRSQAEIEKRLGEIRASYAKKGGGGVAAENKELRDQQRIFAELAGVSSTYYAELANAQKQRAAGVITEQQYVTAVQSLIEKQPFAVALAKEEAAATQALSKSYAEAAAERIKTIQSMERAADSLQSQNDALRDEIELIGLSADQQTLVLQQRNDVIILTKEATLAELERQSAITGTQTRAEIALAAEIEALKERNALLGAKGVKNAAVDAAKTAKDEWQKTTDSINQTLTDSLMRGFESGKDFAKNLRDTLKNMFSTLVLRPVISAVMAPVSGMANGVVQGGMNAAGIGGSSGLMGMASNASSLYGAATGIGSFTTAGMLPSFLSAGLAGSTNALAMGLSGAWGAGGGMLSTLNAGASMLGSGSIMSGLGTIAGALGPIALGLGAIAALSGAFKGRGANHSGGVYSTTTTDRSAAAAGLGLSGGALGDFTSRANADIDKQLGQTVGALSGVYQNLAKYAGDSARQIDIVAGFAINGKYKDEDAYGYFKLLDKLTGEELASYSKRDGGLGNDPDKAWAQYIADMGSALVGEIRKADIPGWMDNIFAGLGDNITTQGLDAALQQIAKVDSAFTVLGNNITYLANISSATQTALLELSGGIDGLMANASAYFQNFYSADEQRAAVQRQLQKAFDGLDLKMPDINAADARAQFRALAEAQDLTTEAGRKTWATLIGLSEGFASVTQQAASAAVSIESVAEKLGNAFGITGEAVAGILNDAVTNAQSAGEAQQMAAQAFEEQFYGNALGGLTDSLGTMIQSSVIAPLMESLVAGAAASAAALAAGGVTAASAMASGGAAGAAAAAAGGGMAAGAMASGGSSAAGAMVSGGMAVGAVVQSAIASAQAQINAYTQILSDPQVQAGIKDISGLIGNVAGMTFNAQQSWGGGGGGGGGGGASAASEADKLREALEALGKTMADEVNRLRGLMVTDSAQPKEVLLAQFTTSTAQARAGDQEAMGRLPELSKAVEQATAASALSSVELARMRGWLAGSLSQTLQTLGLEVPQFAVGTNYVPRDMLAMIHEGEAIVPKAYNPAATGADGSGSSGGAEVQSLHVSFNRFADGQLEASLNMQRLLLRAARVLERWEVGGMPAERSENWSPA